MMLNRANKSKKGMNYSFQEVEDIASLTLAYKFQQSGIKKPKYGTLCLLHEISALSIDKKQ
jgi:hypothetical protein